LNTQLNIPNERIGAANFVYQFSVLSACVGILQVPYMVAINAHERMKVYAYFGIADAAFKLTVAVSLGFASVDKLKFYSVLLFAVYIVMVVFYRIYCHRSFSETHFKWFWDKKMFLERMGFGGWTTLGGMATIAALQGVNMLLNVFHGVVANAAYGIMTQVSNAMAQFANNFFAAVNPQITKSYARGDIDYLHSLLFRSIKFSFLISFALAVPLVLNMGFILNLWLREVPQYAVVFCQIRVVDWCLCMFFIPYYFAITATGKIKTFLIVDSILTMQNLIFVYIFFKLGFSPIAIPVIYICVNIVRIMVVILFSKTLIKISIDKFFSKVFVRLFAVILISLPFPMFFYGNFLANTSIFLILFLPSTIFIGLEKNEKNLIFIYIKNFFQNFLRKRSID
jgi:O-antigen/teichoic acid export membrane protein